MFDRSFADWDEDEVAPITIKNQIIHRDVVAIELEALIANEVYNAVGVSKRHPEDAFDKSIGLKFAYARALTDIANQLDRQAQGAVQHAEDVAKQQQRQAEAKAKAAKNGLANKIKEDHKPLANKKAYRKRQVWPPASDWAQF